MFPIIPLLAIFAICGGGATLVWYDRLSADQQEEADRIACGYAREVFDKGLKELTKAEADHVAMLTRRHFAN
jgi:hypothetical protein